MQRRNTRRKRNALGFHISSYVTQLLLVFFLFSSSLFLNWGFLWFVFIVFFPSSVKDKLNLLSNNQIFLFLFLR